MSPTTKHAKRYTDTVEHGGFLCALSPPAILCSERTCCNLPWQPRFHHQGQLPSYAFLSLKTTQKISFPVPDQPIHPPTRTTTTTTTPPPTSPWHDRRKTTHKTPVLTLLRFRRHFADTWWNRKPRLSSMIVVCVRVCFFFLLRRCFPQSWKSEYAHPPSTSSSTHSSAWLYHSVRRICTPLLFFFFFFSVAAILFASF